MKKQIKLEKAQELLEALEISVQEKQAKLEKESENREEKIKGKNKNIKK